MMARLRLLLLSLWLGTLAAAGAQAAATLVVVSSASGGAYLEATEALIEELVAGGLARTKIERLSVAEFAAARSLAPRLFVALGAEAANALAKSEQRVPVLCTLLPRSSYERALLEGGRRASGQFSALYLDQPLSRHLDLIRVALPDARKVGLLWGPDSKAQAATLKDLARSRNLEWTEASVSPGESLFASLARTLVGADVLLAVADPQVYNSNSIQNILLTSFRARVPVVGFSPAYVRAGALLAVHVTPAQLGRQAGALAHGVLAGKALPAAPLYSQDFEIAVNEHVARSLGLALDAQALRERLLRLEGAP